jgi:hypothetical protein
LKKEVEMVRHDAVVIQPEMAALLVAPEEPKEIADIGGIGKGRFAVVAAAHDMVAGVADQ